jgi:hypothetical protein
MSLSTPASGPIATGAISGPLTIAELLDRTFRALRARFGVLILSAAIVLVPLGVVTALLTGRFMTGYMDLIQFTLTSPESGDIAAEEFVENILGDALGYFGAIMLIAIFSLVGSTLVTLIAYFHIDRFLHGVPSTLADGWRVAMRRILPLIGMQIVQYLAIGFVTMVIAIAVVLVLVVLALIFGGAMAGINNDALNVILIIGMVILFIAGYLLLIVLMLAPGVYFSARWIAAGPSLLIEQLGPIDALQRSWNLTKEQVWRSILYLILLSLFSFLVIGVPLAVSQQIAMLLMPSQVAAILIISTVASYLLNLLYQPFYATGVVMFYYDLRVRNEAYDVALRVAALESEVAADEPAT